MYIPVQHYHHVACLMISYCEYLAMHVYILSFRVITQGVYEHVR